MNRFFDDRKLNLQFKLLDRPYSPKSILPNPYMDLVNAITGVPDGWHVNLSPSDGFSIANEGISCPSWLISNASDKELVLSITTYATQKGPVVLSCNCITAGSAVTFEVVRANGVLSKKTFGGDVEMPQRVELKDLGLNVEKDELITVNIRIHDVGTISYLEKVALQEAPESLPYIEGPNQGAMSQQWDNPIKSGGTIEATYCNLAERWMDDTHGSTPYFYENPEGFVTYQDDMAILDNSFAFSTPMTRDHMADAIGDDLDNKFLKLGEL